MFRVFVDVDAKAMWSWTIGVVDSSQPKTVLFTGGFKLARIWTMGLGQRRYVPKVAQGVMDLDAEAM